MEVPTMPIKWTLRRAILAGGFAITITVIVLMLIFIRDPWAPICSYKYLYLIRGGMTLQEVRGVLGPEDIRYVPGPIPEGLRRWIDWYVRADQFAEPVEAFEWSGDYVRVRVCFKNGKVIAKYYQHVL
jgi:hypothetical protein